MICVTWLNMLILARVLENMDFFFFFFWKDDLIVGMNEIQIVKYQEVWVKILNSFILISLSG